MTIGKTANDLKTRSKEIINGWREGGRGRGSEREGREGEGEGVRGGREGEGVRERVRE